MGKLVFQWVAYAFRRYPTRSALIVILSLLTSVADGLSVSLLIPFLATLFNSESITAAGGGRLVEFLHEIGGIAGPGNELLVISGAIVGLVAIRCVLAYCEGQLSAWMAGRISMEIRSRIHANLLGVGYEFIRLRGNGRLLNALDNEAWKTTEAITTIFGLFTVVGTILACITLLLLISWKLTLLVLVLVGVVSLLRRLLDGWTRRLSKQKVVAGEELYERAVELFDGMRMIRAFGREDDAQQRYDKASHRLFEVDLELSGVDRGAQGVQEVLHAVIFAGVIFIALAMGIQEAPLIAFLALFHRLQPQVKALDEARTNLLSRSASVEAVSELLGLEQWSARATGTRTLTKLMSTIQFDGVTFAYAGKDAERRNAIEDVSLTIPVGRTTAIVGWSGAGKSTLTNLLFRFHDPESGSISIDGVPLTEIDLDWWRSQLAIAGQDSDLMSGTIRENIAYARPDASDEEVAEAARLASIDAFIATLPHGYDTKIGARGVLLSGGQRQRIGLARAFLRKEGILLLDEATNSLDSMTESEVYQSLQGISGGRTMIVIAHRLSTTRMADHVIVLSHGRVVEAGAPADLYRGGGLFSKMVQLQEMNYLVADDDAEGAATELPEDDALPAPLS